MKRTRRLASGVALTLAVVLLVLANARAATIGALSAIVTSAAGIAISDAVIVLSSPTATLVARSGPNGSVTITGVPVDTYRVVVEAPGYLEYTGETVTVVADQVFALHVVLRPPPIRPFAPPPQAAIAAPAPAIGAQSAVHDSLLGLFNASHPVHAASEPYYGRYSYVLLRDGDDLSKAKNRAFVTKLVDRFAASGSTISFSDASRTASPLSYNVFFFPVSEETPAIKVDAHAGAAETILSAYDYGKARDLRAQYCAIGAHAGRSLCTVPYGGGPLLLTFLGPLRPSDATMPPAFAYDFTQVSPDQFDGPLDTVQRKIEVPSGVTADAVLPPPLAAHVANELDTLATALNAGLTGVRAWIDKQPGAQHGK